MPLAAVLLPLLLTPLTMTISGWVGEVGGVASTGSGMSSNLSR